MTLERLGTLLFKPAARYPADPRAVFILALSVFSGLTALLLDAAPNSLHQVLPGWVVMGWGLLLSLGSAVTLLGMSRQSVNGIIIEQVGSITVAATTLFYSAIAFMQVGPSALQSVGIICAWGGSCVLRWFQLQALINSAVGRAHKRAVLDALEAQLAQRAARERANKRFHADEDDHLGQWGA
jgi:hypothetical protein